MTHLRSGQEGMFPIFGTGGQSNDVGNYAPQPSSFADKILFSTLTNNYTYIGPMTTVPTTIAPASRKGGAEVRLAQRLQDAGLVRARIVKVAFGGTQMQAQWNRNAFWPADGSNGPDDALQESLFTRLDREVALGGYLAGFVWWQGWSDAQAESNALAYEDNLTHLLTTIRMRYGEQVHILVVRLNSRWKGGNPGAIANLLYHDEIVAAQTAVCAAIDNCTLVDPDGWDLADGQGGRPTDPPHYAATGQDQAGDAFADLWGIRGPVVVAPGRSLTTRRGILPPGSKLLPGDLTDAIEDHLNQVEHLLADGAVVLE